MEVSIQEILLAREQRVVRQQLVQKEFSTPIICFSMNIAGPVKNSPLIRRGFAAGLTMLDARLPKEAVLSRQVWNEPTGCEALYAVSMDPAELKRLCTAIEESCPLGRLFDIDVLDTQGKKLERSTQRSCLVCGAPGRVCAAGRLHAVSQLQAVTTDILTAHLAAADAQAIAQTAMESLLEEVHITPKPGLVDRRNNGSHRDMDLALFEASARCLKPYFLRCIAIGQETAHLPPVETFPLLRKAGITAEQQMLQTTGGINTHKGAIYTMGVLCGALGRLWTPESPIGQRSRLFSLCKELTAASTRADFAAMTGATAGQRLYLQQGLRGIRGEVSDGLPSVADISLPAYEAALSQGHDPQYAGAVALLHLIAKVQDTNLYHRGGPEGAAWAAAQAQTLLERSPYPTREQLEALDDAFIARNLSPGGCADLLAVTCFLHRLNTIT